MRKGSLILVITGKCVRLFGWIAPRTTNHTPCGSAQHNFLSSRSEAGLVTASFYSLPGLLLQAFSWVAAVVLFETTVSSGLLPWLANRW